MQALTHHWFRSTDPASPPVVVWYHTHCARTLARGRDRAVVKAQAQLGQTYPRFAAPPVALGRALRRAKTSRARLAQRFADRQCAAYMTQHGYR